MKHLVTALVFFSFFLVPASVVSAQESQSLVFETPWTRQTPPNPRVGAIYGVFKNTGNIDIELVKASTEVADRVEIHDMVMENDVMVMRPIEKFIIPAGGEMVLEPRGKHIMLMGMKQQLLPDTEFNISFEFNDGSSMISTVEVRSIGWKRD